MNSKKCKLTYGDRMQANGFLRTRVEGGIKRTDFKEL